MRTMSKVMIFAILILSGCTGKKGPMGPQGASGEPGPGDRIVYLSTYPIPTNELYTVSIPEITLNDMPVVSVYIALAGTDLWYELPAYFEDFPDWGQICFLTEGHVSFEWCGDWNYKIVMVR